MSGYCYCITARLRLCFLLLQLGALSASFFYLLASLPSDPDFLLEYMLKYMLDLPDESDSDDDFEGYLDPEDVALVIRGSGGRLEEQESSLLSPERARWIAYQRLEKTGSWSHR